jgi:5-methylcytosine-specific restriction endonuclease McrA
MTQEKKTEKLNKIFEKTDGHCHLCHTKLVFKNYAQSAKIGKWEIEHSKPKAKGGTDHLNNLFPACVKCNNEKGVLATKTIRARKLVTRAPLSLKKKVKIKEANTLGGAIIGATSGALVGGPIGVIIGSVLGGLIGNKTSPKK